MNDGPGHLGGTLRYLVAATHWSLLAGSGLIIGAGVALVARWPEALWPVHGTALGLMVGMAAVAVDERCATVVDASPVRSGGGPRSARRARSLSSSSGPRPIGPSERPFPTASTSSSCKVLSPVGSGSGWPRPPGRRAAANQG